MRIARAGLATYREICEFWDLDEVYDALEQLDIIDDLEASEAERIRKAGSK